MGFLTPAGLIALLAVPTVLALHLFRRRLRQRRIAAVFLFAPDALAAAAGRKRSVLLRSASLWLELAAALLLALWLGGLSVGATDKPEHLVIVLDDSASMSAGEGDSTTVERAVAAAREAADDLPGSARVTLITSGPRPEIVLGPRAPIGQLDAALERYRPSRPGHDLGPALDLGRALEGTVLLAVTDDPAVHAPDEYRTVAVGRAQPNAAIASARRNRVGADQEKLFVDLVGFGARAFPCRLAIEAAGREVSSRTVTLEPGVLVHVAVDLPASDVPLTASLQDDALAIDNRVVLQPEPEKVVTVANLLDEESTLALRLDRITRSIPSVRGAADPSTADLRFTPAAGVLSGSATEVVIAAPGEERDHWVGPFLLERRHAVLDGLTLEGVVWGAAPGELPGIPLILAGNQTLLAEAARGTATRYHLNLDPLRTNLADSPDWPILLSNVVERARTLLPGPASSNVRIGELITYRFDGSPEDTAAIQLVDPDGVERGARGLGLLTWEARVPGVHRLRAGERELARYAVHFADTAESDLTGRGEVEAEATETARENGEDAPASNRTELLVLALLFLAAAVADWAVLSRGGT